MSHFKVPVLGFAAYSGTGKTTLLAKLIPLLKSKGINVGVIKHAHHNVRIDTPGKDSDVLRKAGANQVLLTSEQRWALMVEETSDSDPELSVLLKRMDSDRLDLVLVEGYRHLDFPKIELHRASLGKPLLFPRDPAIIAIATDATTLQVSDLPILDINAPAMIHEFIVHWLETFTTT
jgi:molybdopterin-guanine dinucleotide biosynthesis protein MobB